ncbi:MAG: beta-galactosidase [Acidobacteriaceae bacterium]
MSSLRRMLCSAAAIGTVFIASAGTFCRAQATNFPDKPPLLLGAAWYPEQWPESQWNADLDRMQKAHIHLVRIGEFAWSAMEPAEGQYNFGWLDKAIAMAAAHNICVVLGTPSAAPPAWLTSKYPQTLRVSEDGVRAQHGNRQQFSFTDPVYRKFVYDIVLQMAKRYGDNPDVVGWQLDNEFAVPDFGPTAQVQFHAWLKNKYGTIANLNQKWATAYWSQTYSTFDQIPVRADHENPALLLDWKRFVSDTWKSYAQNQINALRPNIDPRQFITTNTMGWFDGFNEYELHTILDMAAWDDYISSDHYNYLDNGARHDLTRGYKRKDFWVMETEPVFVDWRKTNTPLKKGQVIDMAWQAIGHGANAVEYWQWRSAPNGQEEYHGTLVGADGEPVPVYWQIQKLGKEFDETGSAIEGTSPHSKVAIINDYDSRWAIDFQRHSAKFDPVQEMLAFYDPLRTISQAVDIVSAQAPLSSYKLVVAPALNVLTKAEAAHLMNYVKGGGHLILGPRSGMKNQYNGLNPEDQPGPLEPFLGARVEQFYALDSNVPLAGFFGPGDANIWAEQLTVTDKTPEADHIQVLERYGKSNGWLDGQPAIVTRRYGTGSITYVGAWLNPPLMEKLAAWALRNAGVGPILPSVPKGVEVCQRSNAAKDIIILINHDTAAHTITLRRPMFNLLKNQSVRVTSVALPKYGVAVLEASPQ